MPSPADGSPLIARGRLLQLAAASLVLAALAYQRPVAYRVRVGAPGDAAYVEGFHDRESAGGHRWRWSSALSRVVFHNAGQIAPRARLRVRLAGPPASTAPPPGVSLTLNGRALGTFAASQEPEIRVFAIDAAWAGAGDWTLAFTCDTFPAHDGRLLGVVVDVADLVPEGAPLLPPARTSLLVVLGALCLVTLLAPRLGEPAAFWFSLVGAGAAAAGLAFARETTVGILPVLATGLALAAAIAHARRSRVRSRVAAAILAMVPPGLAVVCGLAMALVGQILLATGALAPGLSVLLLGMVLLTLTAPTGAPGLEAVPAVSRREAALVCALTALGAVFRLYRLEGVPFAIFRDEARHGLAALALLSDPTSHPLFLGPPVNQPVPYFMLVAAAFHFLGVSLFSLRLVSAVGGAAAVALLWLLAREVLGPRGALLAAFGLAVSSWHVSISRFAVNYVEPSVLLLPAYLLLLQGSKEARWTRFALGGLLVGLAQYAAHSAKAAFLVAGVLATEAVIAAWRSRDAARLRVVLLGILAAATVGLLALTPLLVYVRRNPDEYFARARQVSVLSEQYAEGDYPAARLAANLWTYAGALHVAGDRNGRHHLPGAPLLDPLSGLFFAIGVIAALESLRTRRSRFLLAWWLAGIVPGLLTVDAPSATRTIDAAPATYALAALGALAIAERIAQAGLGVSPRAWTFMAASLLVGCLVYNGWFYFVRMYESPQVWSRFAPIATPLGQRLRDLRLRGALPAQVTLYAPRAFLDEPDTTLVLQFLSPEGLVLKALEDEVPVRASGAAVVIPNHRDERRLAAAAESRYAPTSEPTGKEESEWRARLAPWLSGPSVTGPSFPASDRPTFWLYLPR